MNLALHDLRTFQTLRRDGQTGDWAERGIVAWAPHGFVIENSCLRECGGGGITVHTAAMHEGDAGFYEVFRERFSASLVESEVRLLFLAEQTRSVVLTSDAVLQGCAERLGLDCWNGDATALNMFFPIKPRNSGLEQADSQKGNPPEKFPPRRQVPDRDEPVASENRLSRESGRTPHPLRDHAVNNRTQEEYRT